MVGKKIKLEEQAISEILVADTDSESGDRVTMLNNILRKKKMKRRNNNKPLQKSNHRLQQVANYQPGDCL
jgi:predicted RNA-binding protein